VVTPVLLIPDRHLLIEALGTILFACRTVQRTDFLGAAHPKGSLAFARAGPRLLRHLLGPLGRFGVGLRPARELAVVLPQGLERRVVDLLKIEQNVARLLRDPDQLV